MNGHLDSKIIYISGVTGGGEMIQRCKVSGKF